METAVPDAPAAEPKAAPVEAKEAPAQTTTDAGAKPADGGEGKPAESAADRVYKQEEVDRILAKVKKNERYRTKKEVEAYYQGLMQGREPPKSAEPPKPAADEAPPSREQFGSYEEYLDAKAAHTGRKAAAEYRAKAEAEAKESKAREAQAERVKSFQSKVVEKYPDLNERAEAVAHIEMPQGMGEAITESEFGPDILNHFVENPKDFERIAALSPSAAIREVGKLEARLEGAAQKPAPVAEVKKPSAAPAPIAPVGGTAVVGDGEPSHNDPDAWRAWRDRQVLKRRQGSAK